MLFRSLIHLTNLLKSASSGPVSMSKVLGGNTEGDLDESDKESPLPLTEEEGEMSTYEYEWRRFFLSHLDIHGSREAACIPPGLGCPSSVRYIG